MRPSVAVAVDVRVLTRPCPSTKPAHATANCMLHWPTMERTLGSQFAYHPAFQNATMVVQDPDHPSTKHLPQRWTVEDEVYNFNHDPRDLGAKVVLTVDEDSYEDYGDRSPTQGSPHPIGASFQRLSTFINTILLFFSLSLVHGRAQRHRRDRSRRKKLVHRTRPLELFLVGRHLYGSYHGRSHLGVGIEHDQGVESELYRR